MSALLLSLLVCLCQIQTILGAAYASGHSKCSVIKLYPEVFLEVKVENVSYYDVYKKMYSTDEGYSDLFYSIQHAVNYAYEQSYDYEKDIGAFLAKCKVKLSMPEKCQDDASSLAEAASTCDAVSLFFDMEAYDNDYKYKIEQLFGKKYFKLQLYYEYKEYFEAYGVDASHIYVDGINVVDTSMSLTKRLVGFGIMIAFMCAIFLISSVVIFLYNRTEKHQAHLKQIADEFGFEDISEVSQITHFKLF